MANGKLITEGHDKIYRDTVKQLRQDLGRKVRVYLPGSPRVCPNCLTTPKHLGQKSAGIYSPESPYPTGIPGPFPFTNGICQVCNGAGQYTQTIEKEILCHVRWLIPGSKEMTMMGDLLDAHCRLQADIKHLHDFLRPPLKVKVDGIFLEVLRAYPRGLKKLAQVIVFLKRSDTNVPGNRTRTTYGGPL